MLELSLIVNEFYEKETFNFDEKLIWDHLLPPERYAEYEFNIPGVLKLIKMQFLAFFEKFEIFEKLEKSRKSLGGGIGRRPLKYQSAIRNLYKIPRSVAPLPRADRSWVGPSVVGPPNHLF